MNSNRTSAGPTGFGWARSLLTFRHRNPVARFLSALVAFAMATLLVVGSGAAYGSDTTPPPDPAATTTADPTATDPAPTDTSTPTVTTTDPTPATDPTSSTAPATTAPAPKTVSRTSTTTSTNSLTKVSPLASTPPAVPNWIWQGSAPTLDDGEKDGTAYGQGSSEDTNPSTWSQASADTPKADLLKYYFNVDNTSDLIVSFGFTRASTNGDTAFAAELNQKQNSSNTPPRPVRTPGDVLLKFHVDSGNATLEFVHAFVWKAVSDFAAHNQQYPQFGGNACEERYGSGFGWCEIPRTGGAFDTRVTDDGFTAEAKVDLTELFGGSGCTALFRAVNLRGESSAENWTNSLQDYLPLPDASVPSSCATLVINKYRLGTSTKLAGAHFDVYAGSTVSGTPVLSDVYDGKSGVDTDSVTGQITLTGLEPGTYTITETSGPTGYFAPSGDVCANPDTVGLCSIRTKTVAAKSTATYNFYDLKKWQPLTATKDGTGSYKVTYDWSIDKLVADTTAGPWYETRTKTVAGSTDPTSADFGYQVTLTQGAQHTTDIVVSGDITVTNPNGEDVVANVSDLLTGADCSVTGGNGTTVTPGSHKYAYSCTYPDGTLPQDFDTTNVAKVTWDASTYPQDDGTGNPKAADAGSNYVATSDPYTIVYTPTETNKNVTVTDLMTGGAHHVFSPAWTATWSAEGTQETRTYTESVSTAPGTEKTVVNTAYVKDSATGKTIDYNDATAILRVGKDLSVTKNAFGKITRSYLWKIDKRPCGPAVLASVCDLMPTKFTVGPDGTYTVPYTVEATPNGSNEIGWVMTGDITVTNDNTWEDVTLSSVTDAYPGGSCTVDTSQGLVVPKSGSMTYPYTCTFTAQPSKTGTNTATANWNKAAAATPSGSDDGSYTLTLSDWTVDDTNAVNKTINVYDDKTDPANPVLLGPATWNDTGTSTTYTYNLKIAGVAGKCIDAPNIAYLAQTPTGTKVDQDSVTVTVCAPNGLTLAKTAAGSYDRTYHWTLTKQVKNDQGQWVNHATTSVPSWTAPFDYRVVLTQNGFDDSNWKITGDITVTNTNDASVTDPVSTTLTDTPAVGGTLVGCTRTSDDQPINGTVVTLASGATAKVGYECTFSAKPDYSGGKNTVTGTNATPGSHDVTFAVDRKIDDQVSVYDNKVTSTANGGKGELLGTATYDEGTPGKSTTWTYTNTGLVAASLDCANPGNSFTNTAKVYGDDSTGPVAPDAQAIATICPQPGTWTVAKSVEEPTAVKPGTTLHYTLTATKTGGVDPENINVVDDLGPMPQYLTGDPVVTTAGADTSYAGGKLTWHIAKLSGTQTLEFTVTVKSDAYGVDLPNLVTSPGSSNCPDSEHVVAACTTDNKTPHYTLEKSSDPVKGSTVMPPYLGADGTVITYTLTVHNDSDAPINATTMPGATVTDDLTDVLDNATWLGNLTPSGQAVRSGNTLTWTLPVIPAGGTVTLTYQVQVNADQWDKALTNVATPGTGGECVPSEVVALAVVANPNCTTTTRTPGYALVQALKVDADNPQQGLQGAVFSLSQGEQVIEENVVSDANGVAHFTTKLQPGTFQVTETQAPSGYALPANPTQDVVVDAADLTNGETPVQVRFDDPPIGSLALSKAHQELSGGTWVPGDGQIAFNDQVKYVITVTATGTKVFHDVKVTDYVPGYNPADTQTQLGGFKAAIVGTPTCSAAFTTCSASYDTATGLVTWTLGDVGDTTGTVEFVVRMPDLPRVSPLAAPGVSFAGLMWNQAYLSWTQRDDTEGTAPHTLASNAVTDAASEVLPPKQVIVSPPKQHHPSVLPSTGGPDGLWLAGGLALLLAGGALVMSDRRRRRRS